MDVNNLNNGPLDRRVREGESQPTRDASGRASEDRKPDEAAQSRRDDAVSLSSQARQLKDIESRVSEQDAFDQKRVDDIRAAIAEGRYHIDPARLAERFIALEEELNQ